MTKRIHACVGCGATVYRYPSEDARGAPYCSRPCRYSLATQTKQFWARTTKTDSCWLFSSNELTNRGHARLKFQGHRTLAHRVAYELHFGPIPDGLHCLHTCDVPTCVNPAHLFLGTNADNVADKVAKNRQARGERMNWGKMTESDVRELRRLRADDPSKWTFRALATHFGIMSSHAVHIVQRKTWAHVR